jgi:hypothetical protein
MFALLAFVVGCSQSAPPPPPTAKAHGKIVGSGGEPLNHVVVRLQPLNQTAGGEAQGVVKEGGTFVLQTFRPEDGAMPGKYKVWLQPSPVAPKKASLIPAKYQSADESDLTVLIQEGDNDLNLRLK